MSVSYSTSPPQRKAIMIEISEKRYMELLAKEKELEERKKRGSGRAAHLNKISAEERKERARKAVMARWAKKK